MQQRSSVSGLFIVLLIMGVFLMAVAPPVGFIMIVLGFCKQRGGKRRYHKRVARRVAEIQAERAQREEYAIMLAWKSMP